MEVNYYPDELAHWALDYTTLAASSPGQMREYEPILLPQGIDLWPHGGLPFPHAGSLGVAGNNKAAPLNRFQTSHRKLQCPQIPTGPRVSNHHDHDHEVHDAYFAHGMTQSPEPRHGSYPCPVDVDVDDTPLASPLTPPSDAWTRDHCSRQAGGDLRFQSLDDFRDDIRRCSVETETNAVLPEWWCWGIDTTTAASLMSWTQAERCRPLENPSQQQQPLDPPPHYEQTYHHHHHQGSSSPVPQAYAHTDNNSMAFMRPRRGKQSIEQRRRNHIRQEQKRRAVLKKGFADLADMIPDLAKRDMSKSVVLEKTAEWLETLMCGNKFLQERLSLLDSRSRHGIP